jgi:protein-L-isoaspartate(D-aspartate) O-methyltransferase
MTIDDYLAAYTQRLVDAGAIATPAVERAFRTVRRDRCVPAFYQSASKRITVPQDDTPPADALEAIYDDNALLTRLPDEDARSASSTSQPSLMARMLEALDLQPGHRTLEVGAGTGYNAALITTITTAPVTSIDVQPDVVDDARQAIQRLGLDHDVTVLAADGYLGHPDAAPYQRIIVTVACTGISPRWVDQLATDGRVLAPIAHGGDHPLLDVQLTDGGPVGRPVLWTGFMRASGPLYQWPDPRRPLIVNPLPEADFTSHDDVLPDLTQSDYDDLRYFMATRDPRITDAYAPNINDDLFDERCALIDPDRGNAFITTGTVAITGDLNLLDDIRHLYAEWERLDRPRLTDWQCRLMPAGDREGPILVPAEWSLRSG